jgi:opacity protein-like surface antigen
LTTRATYAVCVTALGLVLLGAPSTARAQSDGAASVAGTVSAFNMDSHTSVAYTAAFTYRFTRVVGLELEATFVPSLNSTFPDGLAFAQASAVGLILPSVTLENQSGRAVVWSNNVRIGIPTTTTRLEPFFVAGGGVASLRRTGEYRFTIPPIGILDLAGLTRAGDGRTLTYPVSSSSTGLALTIGGGVSIKATEHLWIDADLRLVRILGDQDENVGRFGVGARYRF